MNNLPKVVTQLCPEQELNPRPVDRKSNALPVAPPTAPSKEYSGIFFDLRWFFCGTLYNLLSQFYAETRLSSTSLRVNRRQIDFGVAEM